MGIPEVARRSGLSDLLLAFSIISGMVLIYDYSQRGKSAADAKATKARLSRIEKGVTAIHEKLS